MAYLPEGGLAAARTDVLDLSIVVIPAFATEIVCCSMAWTTGQLLKQSISSRWHIIEVTGKQATYPIDRYMP